MTSLRDLKRRIKSVEGIRQITRAMEMVSATKLRRAQNRIEAARPYTEKMDEILAHLGEAVQADVVHHPLMDPHEEVHRLLILAVASDKGLCGGFNSNIIRRIEALAREAREQDIEVALLLVGKKLHDYFRRRDWNIHPFSEQYRSIDQKLPITLLEELTDLCTISYETFEADRVEMVYTEFHSAIVHEVVTRQFLPIVGLQPEAEENGERPEASRDYIFEPDPDRLFSQLIPKYARMTAFRMLADSLASEHGARMNSMRNATDNAVDVVKSLTLHRNKARQAAITKELAEIVSGAEALRG